MSQPLLSGNCAEIHTQMADVRRALLGLVERAQNHINLDAALLQTPGLRAELLACLVEQFRKGVRVQILEHTASAGRPSIELAVLRDAGATVNEIRPPQGILGLRARHLPGLQRQLAVIDGGVAWCGPGLRSTDHCAGGPHVCVQGPIAERLQHSFLDTWTTSGSACRLPQAHYFPPVVRSGQLEMALGSPLVGAIETARSRVVIGMGQQTPSLALRCALARAAGRGIKVSVLMQETDPKDRQRSHCQSELVHAGAWVYAGHRSRPLPPHCIVDGTWSCLALDGGTGWQNGDAVDALSLTVHGAAFAEALQSAGQETVAHAVLLSASAVSKPQLLPHFLTAPNRLLGWFRTAESSSHPAH